MSFPFFVLSFSLRYSRALAMEEELEASAQQHAALIERMSKNVSAPMVMAPLYDAQGQPQPWLPRKIGAFFLLFGEGKYTCKIKWNTIFV